ncbi:MAG: serine/threonine-protein kinase [Myxococcota bacterium]
MGTATRRFVFGPCLGRGSFGEVYAATMRSPGGLESPVAVKLLRADIDPRGEAVRRLRDEGRLLARLNHPAILKVFDLVTLRSRIALITELVEGADLAECLPNKAEGSAAIPVRALVQAIGQVASALDAASSAEGSEGPLRLIHRDVKPSNIRIDRHGQTKLLDFGIARFDASDREVRTASDLVVGSVPYMAPERFVKRGVEPSSDVFSLGCTLYEGLTGKRFYGSSNVARISGLALQPDVYRETIAGRIAELSVAAGVKELLADLVRLEPEERPVAGDVAARLEELSDAIGGPTLRMWCRDRHWEATSGPKGTLEGETIEEGEVEIPPEPGAHGSPQIHRAPLVTIEPGQSAADLGRTASGALPGLLSPAVNPTLAPATDVLSIEQVRPIPEVPPLAKPPVQDSVWERPYTTEGERPAVPPRISTDPEPIARSGRGPLVFVALAFGVLVVIGLVVVAVLAAIPALWVLTQ